MLLLVYSYKLLKHTYLLVLISNLASDLTHDLLQFFPRGTTVARSVNCASISEHKYDLIGSATPHHVCHRSIQIITIIVYLICVRSRDDSA
jgi:hypothetical protein